MRPEAEQTLTDEQQAVVQALKGPLLVLAPVGSGKTLVMARRLAAALESGLEPERCLCLTFTNRAARELRLRSAGLGPGAARTAVFTFHGFCSHLLRREAAAAGLPGEFTVLDDLDSRELLARCHPRRGELQAEAEREAAGLYHDWGRRLSALEPEQCRPGFVAAAALEGLDAGRRAWLSAYLTQLKSRAALDFPLLVHQARSLLAGDAALRARWEAQYGWIQVDEVQDTHMSEWSLLEALARPHGNLAFFGDLDQTIYGWRGSQPDRLLAAFERAFGQPRVFQLGLNHRGTRAILELAGQVAAGLPDRHTRLQPAPHLPQGEPVRWLLADDPEDCARRVAREVLARGGPGTRPAVLARSNGVCRLVAREIERAGGTALLEEDLRLSRRPEVRALLAPLRLVANESDLDALGRWLRWGGLEPELRQAVERVQPHAAEAHLALTDLVRGGTLAAGDPFADLLESWERHHHVVLDVETSGLDPEQDEVLEIACQRWSRDVELDRLHLLLKPTRPLGASAAVHGLDAELLRREGRDPARAFAELVEFIGPSLVVGHNIRFDISLLQGHARRLGIQLPDWPTADTLALARRVLRTGSMRLGDLAARLQLRHEPTHRAMDDVSATAHLLEVLVAPVLESREDRRDLVAGAAEAFRPWAARLDKLRALAQTLRPPELLEFSSGQNWFQRGLPGGQPTPALRRLQRWFQRQDTEECAGRQPRSALAHLLEQAALARPADLLEDEGVPVLTIHAAKGMEFDLIWLTGLCQGVLPDFRNQRGAGLTEERRVCYVGITRARRELCCCAWRLDERGRPAGWSEFVQGAAPA
ncbi:MAG: UvrD-helicase domain-containing protein [Candidatus Delongbacteria bacterium]